MGEIAEIEPAPPPNPWPTMLRLLRRRLNVSIARFADVLGVSQTILRQWDQGAWPSQFQQERILALDRQHQDVKVTRPGLRLVTLWSPSRATARSRCIAEGLLFDDGQIVLRFGLPPTHVALFTHSAAILSAYPEHEMQERIL